MTYTRLYMWYWLKVSCSAPYDEWTCPLVQHGGSRHVLNSFMATVLDILSSGIISLLILVFSWDLTEYCQPYYLNLSTHLTFCAFHTIWLLPSPKSQQLPQCKLSFTITYWSNGQNYKNVTKVAINWNYILSYLYFSQVRKWFCLLWCWVIFKCAHFNRNT